MQNVVILYELAPTRDRLLAAGVDALVVLTGGSVLFWLLASAGDNLYATGPIYVGMLVLAYVLYNLFFDVWRGGQTPGRWLMGTRTIRIDGKPIGWTDALMRALLLLVDGLLSAGLIGFLLIQTSPRGQRLGDIVAHTTVVRIQNRRAIYLADVLHLSSMSSHTVTYPQVRRLNEADLLFTKMVLSRWSQYPNDAHWEVAEQLAQRLAALLQVPPPAPEKTYDFLETLLRDYVALTR